MPWLHLCWVAQNVLPGITASGSAPNTHALPVARGFTRIGCTREIQCKLAMCLPAFSNAGANRHTRLAEIAAAMEVACVAKKVACTCAPECTANRHRPWRPCLSAGQVQRQVSSWPWGPHRCEGMGRAYRSMRPKGIDEVLWKVGGRFGCPCDAGSGFT